jgi:hypothetical protein
MWQMGPNGEFFQNLLNQQHDAFIQLFKANERESIKNVSKPF